MRHMGTASWWRPIASAPRDGSEILGFWEYVYPGDTSRTCGQRVISWDDDAGGWHDDKEEVHTYMARENAGIYTRWTPLLEDPPVDSKESSE